MNRRLFLQVTGPALAIALLLFGACVVSVWNINRLQANLAKILSQNVRSLEAAQTLEISVRQLRFHCLLYFIDPTPARLGPIETDNRAFEQALQTARECLVALPAESRADQAFVAEGEAQLRGIEEGYRHYRDELARARAAFAGGGRRASLQEIADTHPVRHIVDPCRDWLQSNEAMMRRTAAESDRVGQRTRLAMVVLGLLGPVGGLFAGYGIARGLSRTIYELSVSLVGAAQQLDRGVASLSIAADGDLHALDRQIQHVLQRVEQVAERAQQQQRELLRTEQLAAVGQLAAGVAHEVRNPLTSVKMLVEGALGTPRRPLSEEDLQVIHRELLRLEHTVQEFLDFARPPAPRRSLADLRQVIAQAVDLTRARARLQGVEISVTAPDEAVLANVDCGQMTTVLVNLLINSLDALRTGGRIEIALAMPSARSVQLSVVDTGPGIPSEIRKRLFTPFTSTKPTGTGLGLSISRRIIEDHGGRIVGENLPEAGARFCITLPVVDEVNHADSASD